MNIPNNYIIAHVCYVSVAENYTNISPQTTVLEPLIYVI